MPVYFPGIRLPPGQVSVLANSLGPGPAKLSAGGLHLSGGEWSVVGSRPLNPKFVRSDVSAITARVLNVLSADVSAIRLVYSGHYNYTSGDGESPIPNPVFLRASVQLLGSVGDETLPSLGFAVEFSGKALAVLGRGALLMSDPIPLVAKKGAPVYVKTWVSARLPAAPTAPTVAAAAGGSLSNGTYGVAVTYVYDDSLESAVSPGAAVVLSAGSATQALTVNAPSAVAGAIGYRVWVTPPGNSEPYYDSGCGVVPFSANAVVVGTCPSEAFSTSEFVLPSTPQVIPTGSGGLRGGAGAGSAGTGEGWVVGYDTTANSTPTAIVAATSAAYGVGPAAVLGLTSGLVASCAVVGDSIADGSHDSGFGGVAGFISRGVQRQLATRYSPATAPDVGLVVVSQGSETPSRVAGWRFNRRMRLASMARSVINDHATNALTAGAPANIANILAGVDRFQAAGLRYFHTTCVPRTNSLDGFRTLAQQTQPDCAREGARRQINSWYRRSDGGDNVAGEVPLRASGSMVLSSYDFYGPGDGSTVLYIPRDVFVEGSQVVRVDGVEVAAGYSLTNVSSVDGVAYAEGILFTTAPPFGAVVTVDYTRIPALRAMRDKVGLFDSAARVEVNSSGELQINGGWWPADSGTVFGPRVATSASGSAIFDSTLTMATDQYRGYTLTVLTDTTTPAAQNQTRVIASNTSTGFTLGSPWTTTPSSGATFVVNNCATGDGTHPSTRMHIEMAGAIDPSLL